MIQILNNEVNVMQDSNKDYSKFLWDVIDLMANKFIILFISSKKISINYKKSLKYKFDKDKIIIFEGSDYNDFIKILSELSDNCIHDFYVTINSSINTVKNFIEEKNDFMIDDYLKNFNKTIHITENGFDIDLDNFSTYAFQIERIVKRHEN